MDHIGFELYPGECLGLIGESGSGKTTVVNMITRLLDATEGSVVLDGQDVTKAEGREPILLPKFSAHQLRHTFCTRFCENETNLKVIQSIMGHSDITTTMDIYADATQEKKQEIMANLNGKIF